MNPLLLAGQIPDGVIIAALVVALLLAAMIGTDR